MENIPKSMQEKALIFRLKREGRYWRIDKEDFSAFIFHLCSYFKILDSTIDLDYSLLEYADVSDEDLAVACMVFGFYSPCVDRLLLAPVYPESFVIPEREVFMINLCIKLNGRNQFQTIALGFDKRLLLREQSQVLGAYFGININKELIK